MKIREALTYDDIQLVPLLSDVKSRMDVDLSTQLTTNFKLKIPFLSSPMDTISGYEMCYSLMKLGGAGCLHRFMDNDEQCDIVEKLKNHTLDSSIKEVWGDWQIPIIASVGIGDHSLNQAARLIMSGANVILIDVAHGHHLNVKDMIEKLIHFRENSGSKFDIIAGNIATREASEDLCNWGVDGLRANVGNGSLCSTRIETGHGVPTVTSIIDVVEGSSVPVIADGGIRYAGDIAKALAVGASSVMLGSIFAGTQETPAVIIEQKRSLYKRYRGSASLETKIDNNQPQKNIEGVSTTVPYKGGVKYTIYRLIDGLRSALSYSGSHNLMQFHQKSQFVKITDAGRIEAKPHLTI